MTATTTATVRKIGWMVRCASKACKAVRRIDFDYEITEQTRHDHARGFEYPVRIGKYLKSYMRDGKEPYIPDCDKCGHYATGKAIKGYTVPEIKCGDKCRGAIGPACDCSCGGENHGGNHS